MSEIVYAAGEGPSAPRAKGVPLDMREPIGMSRAKTWSEDVEEVYRLQQAGYRDRHEYAAHYPDQEITRWENTRIKKVQRKDGLWNYFNKDRELYKNFHLVKLYRYE